MSEKVRCLLIRASAVFHPSTPLHRAVLEWTSTMSIDGAVAALVEGPVVSVHVRDGGLLYFSREQHPENIVATALAHDAGTISVADWIGGRVVLVGTDEHGHVKDIPDALVRHLEERGCVIEDLDT